jgi:hypothetical protein
MKRTFALLAVVLSVSLCGSATWAATYNPQTAFAGVNPNGVWSYGVLNTANSNPATNLALFSNYSMNDNSSGVNVWSNNPGAPFPGIFNNTNSGPTTVYGTIAVPGDTLVVHPANDNTEVQQADLRFTAPIALDVSNIAATFAAADTSGTTSDAHVYVNGVSVFSSAITGTAGNGTETYNSGPLVLLPGETVDFTVDDGGNGYSNDGTSLVASITAVPAPEPSSLVAIVGLSLAGLVGLVRYRRRRAA